jgi:photosystem II stability/assembly factor-like uncharacterized protein
MFTALVGWGVDAGAGVILRTTDGGATWREAGPRGAEAGFGLMPAFLAAGEAWTSAPTRRAAASSNPCVTVEAPTPVLHTDDGGRTWSQLGDTPVSGSMYFSDREHGWVVSGGSCATQCTFEAASIARTVDGGVHWELVAQTPEHVQGGAVGRLPLACGKGMLDFLTPLIGVLGEGCLSDAVQALLTRDGGVTWDTLRLAPANTAADQSTRPIRFSTASVAFLYGSDFPTALLFATHDGGHSWERLPLPETQARAANASAPVDVNFVDPLDGYFAGSRLYRTSDGGRSWVPVVSDAEPPGAALQFVSLSIGFGLTSDASGMTRLSRTQDGGAHWQELVPRVVR